jgi:hypothetical protein
VAEYTHIQIKVCQDLILRMEEAKKQNNKAAFESEKGKLLDALEVIRTADPNTYASFSYARKTTF